MVSGCSGARRSNQPAGMACTLTDAQRTRIGRPGAESPSARLRAVRRRRDRWRHHRGRMCTRCGQPGTVGRAGRAARHRVGHLESLEQADPRRPALPRTARLRPGARSAGRAEPDAAVRCAPIWSARFPSSTRSATASGSAPTSAPASRCTTCWRRPATTRCPAIATTPAKERPIWLRPCGPTASPAPSGTGTPRSTTPAIGGRGADRRGPRRRPVDQRPGRRRPPGRTRPAGRTASRSPTSRRAPPSTCGPAP